MLSGATTRACERERVAGRVGMCVSVHACSHPRGDMPAWCCLRRGALRSWEPALPPRFRPSPKAGPPGPSGSALCFPPAALPFRAYGTLGDLGWHTAY